MTRYAQAERQALADLLLQVGPDAPTMCEGWRTADLAAHLVIRDRRPDAAAGIIIRPLSGHTDRVQRARRDSTPWPQLVDQVRSGPPLPMRPLDESMNTVEYYIHHEDVRRAQEGWEPRPLDPGLVAALWKRIRPPAVKLLVRRAPTGLKLVAPGYGESNAKTGGPLVTVSGPPGELVLFAFGRSSVARVDFQGDELSVERLRHAHLGL
jgi:uncharacterized protein (TIGR03085 family)